MSDPSDIWARLDVANREALQRVRHAYAAAVERLGSQHPDTMALQFELASSLRRLGRAAEAEPLLVDLRALEARGLGDHRSDPLDTGPV